MRHFETKFNLYYLIFMPKLYNSIKIDQGLKIGLRDPDGSEWFVDMTYDRNKRTCRKLGLKYQESNKKNKEEAIVAGKNFYLNFLKEKEENLSLNLPQRLTRVFTLCLFLLWVSGVAWLITEINSEQFKNTETLKNYLMVLHGLFVIPALIAFGGLIYSHFPSGEKIKKKKRSGMSLYIFLGFLIITGASLFYLEGSYIRFLTSYSHALFGIILLPIIFWHYRKRSIN